MPPISSSFQPGFRQGVIANLPVAASVGAYGSVLGVLAAQHHLTWVQLLTMNLSVFAGSAQFVMVDMWTPPQPIVEMTIAVMIINLRYLLIGASLFSLFRGRSIGHRLSRIHLVADENWAVTMAAQRRAPISTDFLFGGGLCLVTVWCLGTLLGHHLGAMIAHPERFALDFAFVAVFTALAMRLFRGRNDVMPWLAAAVVAVLIDYWLPGKWYVVFGGIAGAATAAFQEDR